MPIGEDHETKYDNGNMTQWDTTKRSHPNISAKKHVIWKKAIAPELSTFMTFTASKTRTATTTTNTKYKNSEKRTDFVS